MNRIRRSQDRKQNVELTEAEQKELEAIDALDEEILKKFAAHESLEKLAD